MRRWAGWLVLLCVSCAATEQEPNAEKKSAANPEAPRSALPEGFEVKGEPSVRPPFLAPDATWRFLVSRMSTLRADARALGMDVCVTFEENAFHVTERSGARRTWMLPDGLRLSPTPVHVVVDQQLTTSVFAADGTQVPAAEEITVVTARVEGPAKNVEEFRLVVKGGRGFRSISTAEPD